MAEVVIALGSNTGDKLSFLIEAITKIKRLGTISAMASLYRSSAYGYTNQPDFYNSVIILNTNIHPDQLLKALKKIETQVGRTKSFVWGPREIDLDLILYNQVQLCQKELTIPHPDFHNRIFVLQPLAEIAPDYMVPGVNVTIRELLENCKDKTIIEIVKKDWYSNGVKI